MPAWSQEKLELCTMESEAEMMFVTMQYCWGQGYYELFFEGRLTKIGELGISTLSKAYTKWIWSADNVI